MSKITVRADDELVSRLEAMDASKSQIVREALRAYLTDAGELRGVEGVLGGAFIEDADGGSIAASSRSLDAIVAERVDDRIAERLPELADACVRDALVDAGGLGRDVNVNITLDGADLDDVDTSRLDVDGGDLDAESTPAVDVEASSSDSERAGAERDETASDTDTAPAADASAGTESAAGANANPESEVSGEDDGQEHAVADDAGGGAGGAIEEVAADDPGNDDRSAPDEDASTCAQCGSRVSAEHVHCPNCGAKTSRRVFCECGDEVRSDWSFCPSCGRRTAAAGVLDSG